MGYKKKKEMSQAFGLNNGKDRVVNVFSPVQQAVESSSFIKAETKHMINKTEYLIFLRER